MPFHTQSSGVDAGAFTKGFVRAIDLAKQNGVDVIYFVPTLANLQSDAPIEVLGQSFIDELEKHRQVTVSDVTIHVETKLKKRTNSKAIVFALYTSPADLKKLQEDYRTVDTVFVPWSEPERLEYEAANAASVVL